MDEHAVIAGAKQIDLMFAVFFVGIGTTILIGMLFIQYTATSKTTVSSPGLLGTIGEWFFENLIHGIVGILTLIAVLWAVWHFIS